MRIFKATVTDVNSGTSEHYNVSADDAESARLAVMVNENIQTPNYQVSLDEYETEVPSVIDIYAEENGNGA